MKRFIFFLFLLIGIASLVSLANGYSFVNDPDPKLGNNGLLRAIFRPVLWGVPTVKGVKTLKYTLAPKGVAIGTKESLRFTPAEVAEISDAAARWNKSPLEGENENVSGALMSIEPNPLPQKFDFQSTVLHEFGHAIGLSHPNVGPLDTRASHGVGPNGVDDVQPGPDMVGGTSDDPIGDDVLFNFKSILSGPFKADLLEFGPGSLVTSRETSAREVAKILVGGVDDSEGVMIVGARRGELTITLGHDDVNGIEVLHTGRDFEEGTADDFKYNLSRVAFGTAGVQINIFKTDLGDRVLGQTVGIIDRLKPGTKVKILFDVDENGNVIGEVDVWLSAPREPLPGERGAVFEFVNGEFVNTGATSVTEEVRDIFMADMFIDPSTGVPGEPSPGALSIQSQVEVNSVFWGTALSVGSILDVPVSVGDTVRFTVALLGTPRDPMLTTYTTEVAADDPAEIVYVAGSGAELSGLNFALLADPDSQLNDDMTPSFGNINSAFGSVSYDTHEPLYRLEYVVQQGLNSDPSVDFTVRLTGITSSTGLDSVDGVSTFARVRLNLVDTGDSDNDGILDEVDTLPTTFSNDFSDIALGGMTTGTITARGDQILTIGDSAEPLPDDGVFITADPSGGAAKATFHACGVATISLGAGAELIVSCSSATIEVISGSVDVTFVADDGRTATLSIAAGNGVTFDPTSATLTAPPTNLDTLVVLSEGVVLLLEPGETISPVRLVDIDIKPGSDPNSINISSAGVIPVAILSSGAFDAATVNPDTISLNGASVKMVGKSGKFLCHDEDANGDALPDLVCQVLTEGFMIEVGQTVAVLDAETLDGTPIRGKDTVNIVPDN